MKTGKKKMAVRTVWTVLAVAVSIMSVMACAKKKEEGNPAVALLMDQLSAQTFVSSCTQAGGVCQNYYKSAMGRLGALADCVSGTKATTKCPASTSVGYCAMKYDNNGVIYEASSEKVYYTSNFNASSAQTDCLSQISSSHPAYKTTYSP